MFDKDVWSEIFQSIRKNKLRSVLSGFTITFAILIFTLLFGIANGLQNTFQVFFADDATNAIFIRSGNTSKPYKGNQTGKRIQFTNKDYNFLKNKNKDKIEFITSRVYKSFTASYLNNKNNYPIRAVHPDHQFIEKSEITQGRFLNHSDIKNNLKVAIIGRKVYNDLFNNKIAVGKYINLQDLAFQVVGVFEDSGNATEESIIYIPISTAQKIYGNNDYVNEINLTYNPKMNYTEAMAFGVLLREQLKKRFSIAPKDQAAIRIRNIAEEKKGVDQMVYVLGILVFFIGFGTLIAGIVGISNIMVYIVKERTKELGIRKVLGASPKSIVSLIILECVTITSFAGYLGMLLGMGALYFIGDSLEAYFITDPSVNTSIVIGAMIVLVIAGTIAGYLPAKKASEIKPIVALRAE
jgi:putative ABC transport system permease protein